MVIESLKCPSKVGNDSIEGYMPLLKLFKYVDEEQCAYLAGSLKTSFYYWNGEEDETKTTLMVNIICRASRVILFMAQSQFELSASESESKTELSVHDCRD